MDKSDQTEGTNPNQITSTQTPKTSARKHSELSPAEEGQEVDPKKQRSEMTQVELDLKLFMEEMRRDIANMTQKIDDLNVKFDSSIEKLISDVNQVKKDLIDVRAEVMQVEEDNAETRIKLRTHENELNALNQRMIDNNITMVNIAPTIDENLFLSDMNKWSENVFKESIMEYNITSSHKYKTKSAHIHFKSMDSKKKFLKFLKTKQQDVNKKYIPVLNENIFTLSDSDVNRANVIDFRTPMTPTNREIFNLARKARKNSNLIDGVWISNGTVKIQIKNGKPIQIKDVEHLKETLSAYKIEIPRSNT